MSFLELIFIMFISLGLIPNRKLIAYYKSFKSLINNPVCLIGGINKNNINKVMMHGPDLIAISKSLKSIPDIIKVTSIYSRN